MARLKVLAIAVASGRMGYVFFDDKRLQHWSKVRKASGEPKLAVAQVSKWVKRFQPDYVITEDVSNHPRKGDTAKDVIEAVADVVAKLPVSGIVVKRVQQFQNKYEEAKALAQQFPDLLPWVPKQPQIWESEPRNTIYFEALALALPILHPRNEAT